MFKKSWPMAMFAKALGLAIPLLPSAAFAHVTLEQQQASVGTPYKIVLRVPHGCGDSATIRLNVQIPEGVIAIKPMVKAGWQIATTRGPYSKAYSFFHGAKFTEGVKEVIWSGGKLPDAFYDEFVLSAFIAGELSPGQILYFPVVQQCEQGEHLWVEIPPDGTPAHEPAPGVTLTPKN
jgi:uncharacterized protein YcnI